MNFDLLCSALTFVLICPLLLISRRSIAFVFLISVATFVVALPWLRWIVADSLSITSNQEILLKYVAIYLFSMGVVIVSLVSQRLGVLDPQWIRDTRSKGINSSLFGYSVAVLLAVWVLRIYRASSYGILFSGSAGEFEIANQDYYFVIAMSLMDMMTLGALYYLIIFSNERKYIAWSLIVAEICWVLVSSGRRGFIFIVALLFFVKFVVERRNRIRLLISIPILSYVLIAVISPVFLYSRNSALNYLFDHDVFTSMVLGVQDTLMDLWSQKLLFTQVLNENLSSRGDAGQFLSSIVSALEFKNDYLFGGALYTSFEWSLPSVIITKPPLMVEQLIQARLGMPLADDAVSWLVVAYADFGMAGSFLYGMIFAFLISFLIYFSRKVKSSMLYMIGSVQACYVAYNVEADPLLLFASLRNMLILILCYLIFRKLFFQKRAQVTRCLF
jgi:hypothetical protein